MLLSVVVAFRVRPDGAAPSRAAATTER
jgi:hypothetical protein